MKRSKRNHRLYNYFLIGVFIGIEWEKGYEPRKSGLEQVQKSSADRAFSVCNESYKGGGYRKHYPRGFGIEVKNVCGHSSVKNIRRKIVGQK